MADNVAVTAGSGTTIAADELTDATLGLVKVQYVKLMDGTLDGSTKAAVGANGLKVDGSAVTQPVSLAAETTKVIGVTRNADGTGNLLTSTASALDINIKSGVNANGQATMANSAPVTIASNQASIPVAATTVDPYSQYETVAASQSAQVMGATGATGDYLAGVLVFPGTAGCGVVTILDNATTIGTFAGGGTTALPSLVPFMIPVGLFSTSGAWKITTGANVTAVGVGKFT